MAYSNSPPTGLTWTDKSVNGFFSSELRDGQGALLATVMNRNPHWQRPQGKFLGVVYTERINEWFETEEDAKAWCVAMVRLS